MEPLLRQLRQLPAAFRALPAPTRTLIVVGAALALLAGLAASVRDLAASRDAYVYTNLAQEDGQEAAVTLRAAGIPHRLEAGGSAILVPSDRVHDARLLLATQGIPRAGHVGFELFDKGDMGVSQFTQKVNLRRALEGELSRTVGSLSPVTRARVHLTLPERGLHPEDDRSSAAAVVVNLRPGLSLNPRELAGIRHLVAAAVPGLVSANVHVVDGAGAVLSGDEGSDGALRRERALERDLERRAVELLEPVVGTGRVLARASVELDAREQDVTQEVFDAESPVVRSERTQNVQQNGTQGGRTGGIAGAAANQAPGVTASPGGGASQSSTQTDETRNYEIGKTVTVTRSHQPRVARQSVAVIVDQAALAAGTDVGKLQALVRSGLGMEEARGDRVEIVTSAFAASGAAAEAAEAAASPLPAWTLGAAGAGVVGLAGLAWLLLRRHRRVDPFPALRPGQRVVDAELLLPPDTSSAPAPVVDVPAVAAPPEARVLVERARALALKDPERAAWVLRTWMSHEPATAPVTTEARHDG
ncbi:MAG: flagellar M-ring protein FliF [Deltaproteobacteria bacterium]|nr:flagellar M-ring protein FliF [Deltaproteobacteria bacterium]